MREAKTEYNFIKWLNVAELTVYTVGLLMVLFMKERRAYSFVIFPMALSVICFGMRTYLIWTFTNVD